MARKVNILTMHAVLNYGSYLQTLATYKFVEGLGFKPLIVDYRYPTKYHLTHSKNFVARKKQTSIENKPFYEKVFSKLACWLIRPNVDKKKDKFAVFYQKHVQMTRPYYTEDELKKNPPQCDICIAGSDQIWNPLFIHHDKSFFLAWAPDGCKKISYASSVTIKEMPDEFIEDYKSALSSFAYISVREGSSFLQNLLHREVKTVLDPTFLLNKNEWTQYFSPKPLVKGDYILCYILSYSYNPYPYIYELIEKVRKELGLPVVIIDGKPSLIYKGYKVFVNAGPSEFLNLFYNAKFVITTSFHGTAFAINFNKNFLSVINDLSQNDNRICSLAEQVGIVETCVIRKNTPLNKIQIPSLNYDVEINETLEGLRTYSINYLKKALIDK